jgi:hypothetical protein
MPFNLIERHGSVEKAAGLNGCLATFSPRTVDWVRYMMGRGNSVDRDWINAKGFNYGEMSRHNSTVWRPGSARLISNANLNSTLALGIRNEMEIQKVSRDALKGMIISTRGYSNEEDGLLVFIIYFHPLCYLQEKIETPG